MYSTVFIYFLFDFMSSVVSSNAPAETNAKSQQMGDVQWKFWEVIEGVILYQVNEFQGCIESSVPVSSSHVWMSGLVDVQCFNPFLYPFPKQPSSLGHYGGPPVDMEVQTLR